LKQETAAIKRTEEWLIKSGDRNMSKGFDLKFDNSDAVWLGDKVAARVVEYGSVIKLAARIMEYGSVIS
jgi:exosome complex RNA-binding protein Csl4